MAMDPMMTHIPSNEPGMEQGMQMTFNMHRNVTIMFTGWRVTDVGGLIGSCIAVFAMSVLYEGLKVGRQILLRRFLTREGVLAAGSGQQSRLTPSTGAGLLLSWGHLLQTGLHIVQVTLSYFLMLIFMTYNGYLCIAVVLGAGVGYFLFAWKQAIVVEDTEHCN